MTAYQDLLRPIRECGNNACNERVAKCNGSHTYTQLYYSVFMWSCQSGKLYMSLATASFGGRPLFAFRGKKGA